MPKTGIFMVFILKIAPLYPVHYIIPYNNVYVKSCLTLGKRSKFPKYQISHLTKTAVYSIIIYVIKYLWYCP